MQIWLEFWSIRLRVFFIKEGFCPCEVGLIHRVACLRQYLRSKKLKFLEYALWSIIFDIPEIRQENFVNEFCESLTEQDWEMRAKIRLVQATRSAPQNPERVQELLDEAEGIYTKTRSDFGILLVASCRIYTRTVKMDESSVLELIDLSFKFEKIGMISEACSVQYLVERYIVQDPGLWYLDRTVAFRFMSNVNYHLNQLEGEQFRLLQCIGFSAKPMSNVLWSYRDILSSYLENYPSAVTPKFQSTVFDVLAGVYLALNDFEMARAMIENLCVCRAAKSDPYLRSTTYVRLAQLNFSEVDLRLDHLDYAAPEGNESFERMKCFKTLETELDKLEESASEDVAADMLPLAQKKRDLIVEISEYLKQQRCTPGKQTTNEGRQDEPSSNESSIPVGWISFVTANKDKSSIPAGWISFSTANKDKALELVGTSSLWLQGLEKDSKASKADLADAYLSCARAQHSASNITTLTEAEEDAHIRAALDMFEISFKYLREVGNYQLVIASVLPYLELVHRYVQTNSAERKIRLDRAIDYILTETNRIQRFRSASIVSSGFGVGITDRLLSSRSEIQFFNKVATQFCLIQDWLIQGYILIQHGQGIAFLNSLYRSSYQSLKKSIRHSPKLQRLELEVAARAQRLMNTPIDNYEKVKSEYVAYLDKIKRKHPVVSEMIELAWSGAPMLDIYFEQLSSDLSQLAPGIAAYHITWWVGPLPPYRIWVFMSRIRDWKGKPLIPPETMAVGSTVAVLSDITNWKKKHLVFPPYRPKPLEVRRSALRLLEDLVSPIAKCIDKNHLLILTLPATLALIPVHGIPIDGIPLIERNPVVYSFSLALYENCLRKTRKASKDLDRSLTRACLTAAFEDNYQEYSNERESIYQALDKLSHDLGAPEPVTSTKLTWECMKDTLESGSWVHYHGHAQYPKLEPLKQGILLNAKDTQTYLDPVSQSTHGHAAGTKSFPSSLKKDQASPVRSKSEEKVDVTALLGLEESGVLPDKVGNLYPGVSFDVRMSNHFSKLAPTPSCVYSNDSSDTPRTAGFESEPLLSESLSHTSALTVEDILNLDLHCRRPFICLIACDSGVLNVSGGDEPLGMLSALFCRGASGAIGTLWPIESRVGRLFTKHFYEALLQQIQANEKAEERETRQRKKGKGADRTKVLNLATAMRHGVLAVRKEREDPYAWAAFVLHGSGFYCY